MAFKAASSGATPLNPFSDFLNTSNPGGGKWESASRDTDYTKNAVILISAGNYSSINNPGPAGLKGITASGLYGILQVAKNSNVALPDPSVIGYDPTGSLSFVYNSPENFISHLNQIHNNINDIIRQHIPASSYTDKDVDNNLTGPNAAIPSANTFNFINNIMFPGSYTGDVSTGVLPTRTYTDLAQPDVTGRGITAAFALSDGGNREYTLSRTGIEFYTVLTALAYGATVVVGGNYTPLAEFKANNNSTSAPLTTQADAFMMLDMSTYVDGQGITSASSNSRLVYGGSENAYPLGNTFNYCHGLTAQWLNSIYTEITRRNNIVNGTLDDNANLNTKSAYIIHAGLSGADISIAQNSLTNNFSDVYRYPGFDGQASLYQNINNTAGLTAYTLIEDPYLDRLFCVIGKKSRKIKSSNFGDPVGKEIKLEIPLIADVAGAIQRAKSGNGIYKSAVGYPYSAPLNCDSITPVISSSSDNARLLQSKRINYYVNSSDGLVLSTDLVGATSAIGSNGINDRIGVTSMKRVITDIAKTILQKAITDNRINNSSVRVDLANKIQNEITNNSGLNAALTAPSVITVEFLTDSTVSATITFYPIQAGFGTTVQNTALNGYTLTVTAQ